MNAIDKAPAFKGVSHFWAPKPGRDPSEPVAFDIDGNPIGYEKVFERNWKNLVTTEGKNSLLEVYFGATAKVTPWYAGLISSVGYSAIAAADTMASHAGWTEANATNAPNYSAANRSTITFGAAAAGVKASSSIPAFTFSNGGTVKGLFSTTGQVKGATTGVLYSAGLFTDGDAVVLTGYIMTCTFSVSQT